MNDECVAPCLGEHRETLAGGEDEHVLIELRRAWGYLHSASDTDWMRQDWATFRAITLREARRRGLAVPTETLALLAARGVHLGS